MRSVPSVSSSAIELSSAVMYLGFGLLYPIINGRGHRRPHPNKACKLDLNDAAHLLRIKPEAIFLQDAAA